ncbi:MAG: exodeoxyribonuclease V subunit gamma, partial [Deltaproteobacteria bacterium]|nr:exodeoxyribonuclease V subunit gamma [Deltaproteobacteria bacterium]
LWRALTNDGGRCHKAAIRRDFLRAASRGELDRAGLPRRISGFGIPFLPPLHLEVFNALSSLIDVHIFLLDPCREYWADLFSEKTAARFSHRSGTRGVDPAGLHIEVGHPLLASTGRMGAEFLGRILDLPEAVTIERFQEPGEDTLLHCLQSDILNLRDRGADGERTPLTNEDRSVQIHSCHGPMREVEVLHDQLLDLFERFPGLEPRDIIVMTPDIEAYAPYVTAVFDSRESDLRIPYSIADRSPCGTSPSVDAFLRILGMHGGRFGAAEVVDLLEQDAIRRRFGLETGDMGLIRGWVEGARIRWGLDAKDRLSHDLPPFDDNSWRVGLDRLMLGYAMPGGKTDTFHDILPYDHVEGEQARVLGRFVDFAENLFEEVRALDGKRDIERWAADLRNLVSTLFMHDDDTEWEAGLIDDAFEEMLTLSAASGFEGKPGLEVIRAWLAERLGHVPMSAGFLTGGVTFCAMVPMRSIPFRVVALIGMNDGAFPRQSRPLGFDLMAEHPLPGDPSRREEDRHLFLEALLSARDVLYLSYVGQDIRDNSESPPSVLACELLDTVSRGFDSPDGGDAGEHLLTKHRLQAFSPAYFKRGDELFSFSRDDFEAVRAMLEGEGKRGPFITTPLPDPSEIPSEVTVDDLCSFLSNPSRHFLGRRLGARLRGLEAGLDECESFSLSGLDRYQLGQDMVRWRLEGRDLEDCFVAVRASGVLPPGEPGRTAYRALAGEVESLAKRVKSLLGDKPPTILPVDLNFGKTRLTGGVTGVRDRRLVRFRMASIKPKDRLCAWVEHLALCAAMGDAAAGTCVVGTDGVVRFTPVAEAGVFLSDLLSMYLEGNNRPIPFFPESSWAYMGRAGKDPAAALKKAADVYAGGNYSRGESEDPWIGACFRRVDPIDGEFEDWARRVLEPLIAAQEGGGS